jgi:hypothetical protein
MGMLIALLTVFLFVAPLEQQSIKDPECTTKELAIYIQLELSDARISELCPSTIGQ